MKGINFAAPKLAVPAPVIDLRNENYVMGFADRYLLFNEKNKDYQSQKVPPDLFAPECLKTNLLDWVQNHTLHHTDRPGLRALVKNAGLKLGNLDETDIGFNISPRLNATGRLDNARPLNVALIIFS